MQLGIHGFCSNVAAPLTWMTVMRLLLLGPVLEEWIIRAGLQQWLMGRAGQARWQQAGLVVLPACVFSLLHVRSGLVSALLVFMPGLALGLLYAWKRDWRICAVAHGFFNLVFLNVCFLL